MISSESKESVFRHSQPSCKCDHLNEVNKGDETWFLTTSLLYVLLVIEKQDGWSAELNATELRLLLLLICLQSSRTKLCGIRWHWSAPLGLSMFFWHQFKSEKKRECNWNYVVSWWGYSYTVLKVFLQLQWLFIVFVQLQLSLLYWYVYYSND